MRFIFVIALLILNAVIFSIPTSRGLTVSFLDVGQGDAIFIEGPTGVQLLIDGGATRAVLRNLSSSMPFFDRSIDAVLATHPDQDHVGGLVYVFERYTVANYIESGNMSDTETYRTLDARVQEERAARTVARRGMRLLLGGGAYADVLFPDRDVSAVESNTASIILRVIYGDTEVMLTGDAPSTIERYIATVYPRTLASDVLKAGHHGSKTSSSEVFVRAVDPKYVVYSRGCDNRYGHPAPETMALFQRLNIPAFDTCELGTITFHSNGRMVKTRR